MFDSRFANSLETPVPPRNPATDSTDEDDADTAPEYAVGDASVNDEIVSFALEVIEAAAKLLTSVQARPRTPVGKRLSYQRTSQPSTPAPRPEPKPKPDAYFAVAVEVPVTRKDDTAGTVTYYQIMYGETTSVHPVVSRVRKHVATVLDSLPSGDTVRGTPKHIVVSFLSNPRQPVTRAKAMQQIATARANDLIDYPLADTVVTEWPDR